MNIFFGLALSATWVDSTSAATRGQLFRSGQFDGVRHHHASDREKLGLAADMFLPRVSAQQSPYFDFQRQRFSTAKDYVPTERPATAG